MRVLTPTRMSHDPTPTLADLLDRYLAGELPSDQHISFEERLRHDPQLAAAAARLRSPLGDAQSVTLPMSLDVDAAWVRQRKHVEGLRGAASTTRATGNDTLGGRSDRRQLGRRAGRESMGLGTRTLREWKQACFAVASVVCIVLLLQWKSPSRIGTSTTYTTRTGQRASLILPDGTRATLAPRTTLRIINFGSRTRTVALDDGEAYFDVTHSTGAPFIVHAGNVATRVIGTTFLVRHYRDDPGVRVLVTSGKVNVATVLPRHAEMTLTAGNVVDVRDSVATVRTVENGNGETEWVHDNLVFTNVPVADVLKTLHRWYGYEFRVDDPTLANEIVTIAVSAQSSSTTLAVLEQLLNVRMTVSGDTVTLKPRHARGTPKGQRIQDYDVWTPSKEVGR